MIDVPTLADIRAQGIDVFCWCNRLKTHLDRGNLAEVLAVLVSKLLSGTGFAKPAEGAENCEAAGGVVNAIFGIEIVDSFQGTLQIVRRNDGI